MNTEDNLKKEIKENWKEKWLIKKESKCWWEKMVDESFDKAYSLAKSETLKKVFEIMRKMKGYCNEYEDVVDDMIREIKGIKKKSYYAK